MLRINKFASGFFAIVTTVSLTSCGGEKVEQVKEPAVRPIKLLTVKAASSRSSSRYPAVINAAQLSELSFQVGGLLQELTVIEAQEISEGSVIAKLDQRDFQSNLASATSQYNNASKEYKRAVNLSKENAISKSVLEQRKSQRNVAKAQLDSAIKALEDTVLVAPFSGLVAQVPVKRLQTIPAGQLVATLIDVSELEATVSIPAAFVAQIESRTDRLAEVMLDAAPDSPIEAKFKEATLLADSTSQTYAVTFSFPPPQGLNILPGMNATLELSSTSVNQAEQTNRVSVPLAAVLDDGGTQFVWVVDNDKMTVSKRGISVEEGIGETLVITEGIQPGETIAGAGATYLAEGMQVRPWTN